MKGDYNDECNRTACNNKPATYFNHSTQKHYCIGCADLINQHNVADAYRLFGHDLCTRVKTDTCDPTIQGKRVECVMIGIAKIPEHIFLGKEYSLHVVEPTEPPAPVREIVPLEVPKFSQTFTAELVISEADLDRLRRLFQKGLPPIDPIALQRATEAVRIAGERIKQAMKERHHDKIPVPKAYQRNRFKQ